MNKFRLEQKDCIEGMKAMADESVDVVVTSPPYNIKLAYKGYKDNLRRDKYLIRTWRWTDEVIRVLKPNGSFFLNIGSPTNNPTLPFQMVLHLTEYKLQLQNTLHWVKSISVTETDGKRTTVGPYKPKNSKRFVNSCHEYIFHFTKSGDVPLDKKAVGVPYKWKGCIKRFEKSTHGLDLRDRGNAWFIRYPTNYFRGGHHPAKFPVELPEMCIKLHDRNSELVVLDPFLGTGSTAVAAKRCRVKGFIGFDKSDKFVNMSRRRLEKSDAEPGRQGMA